MISKKVLRARLYKLKAGAKAVGKKITDPDSSLKEEYNQEKSE